MTKRLDNTAFVKRMMDYSPHGAMTQIFILDAIQKAADRCAAMDADAEAANGGWGFVSPHAWQAVAADIQRQFAERSR